MVKKIVLGNRRKIVVKEMGLWIAGIILIITSILIAVDVAQQNQDAIMFSESASGGSATTQSSPKPTTSPSPEPSCDGDGAKEFGGIEDGKENWNGHACYDYDIYPDGTKVLKNLFKPECKSNRIYAWYCDGKSCRPRTYTTGWFWKTTTSYYNCIDKTCKDNSKDEKGPWVAYCDPLFRDMVNQVHLRRMKRL